MDELEKQARFEECVMPHLDAAYNLARWLVRNEHDAQDLVQDAFLRAFKFFDGYRGGNSRSWLLSIVRNTCYTWFEKQKKHQLVGEFDEEHHDVEDESQNPQTQLLQTADADMVREAIGELPTEFREVIVLRELEDMAYKDIAEISGIPIGTVMSRLARARKLLQTSLRQRLNPGGAT